ncbi:MAG: 6,7-dimethyl-8-ribityllumazine synthase [Thermoanaerobaculia bacterium]
MTQRIEGNLDGAGRRFGIVASRFNGRVVGALLQGAIDALARHHVADEDILVVRVPGAWEIPQALRELARHGDCHALIALGAVIQGETDHYDFICAEASRGIARVADETGVPVAFGVLTCKTSEQARERAGGKAGNKGWEAAVAALEMADVTARIRRMATAPASTVSGRGS